VEGIKLKRAEGKLRLLRKHEGRVKFFGRTFASRDESVRPMETALQPFRNHGATLRCALFV